MFWDNYTYSDDYDDYAICCNQPSWKQCDCDQVLSWEDVQEELDPNTFAEAYSSTNTECTTCANHFTPYCPSLREWILSYFENGYPPDSIETICLFYDEQIARRLDVATT